MVACGCQRILPHQSKLVDLYIECLQLSWADLLCFLGEEFVCLQVYFEPVHLHLPTGVQPIVQLSHTWSHTCTHSCIISHTTWIYNLPSHTNHTVVQQTCKFVEVVANVEGLVVVAGVFIVYEPNVTWKHITCTVYKGVVAQKQLCYLHSQPATETRFRSEELAAFCSFNPS